MNRDQAGWIDNPSNDECRGFRSLSEMCARLPCLSDPFSRLQRTTAHMDTGGLSEIERNDVVESKNVLADFKAADIVVLDVPLYNYSVPSTLRAWIDRIIVFGKTFQYNA